jgi:thymidylate synthase
VSVYLRAETIADAWTQIMGHLLQQPHGKCFHLVTTIADPVTEVREVTRVVDALANAAGTMSTMENANAIWPHVLARPGLEFDKVMWRVKELAVPVIKRANPKNSDSYLGRIVGWRSKDESDKVPQLENMISRMQKERLNPGPKTSVYEIAIFSPGLDAGYLGFPCLSHLSFKLDVETKRIHLTALYRNHHFVTHGYGNFLGLGRLIRFVGDQVGYQAGEMMSISTHADAEFDCGKSRIAKHVLEANRILKSMHAPRGNGNAAENLVAVRTK